MAGKHGAAAIGQGCVMAIGKNSCAVGIRSGMFLTGCAGLAVTDTVLPLSAGGILGVDRHVERPRLVGSPQSISFYISGDGDAYV